ncbi:MAG: epoxyqueuosine reductase QueH [Candidatus Omnitrophota bacterium]
MNPALPDIELNKVRKSGVKLLLHICCGPCSIHPARTLAQNGFAVDGFFYNPNIHPQTEYILRREALCAATKQSSMKIVIPQYNADEFYKYIGTNEQKPERCGRCWELRLRKTAEFAGKNGYDAFTTTLLISPYQDHNSIKYIGEKLANEFKADFHYADLRPGFSHSQSSARDMRIYRQKYCGCDFSLRNK